MITLNTVPQPQEPKRTLLLVEDNSAARMALTALLEASGYHVLAAQDGIEAETLFTAQADTVDLLISDLVLPRIEGPELYGRLKQIKPSLRCVLMSGFPLADEQERLHRQGIRHWIQKPFMVNDLITLVESALGT